MPQTHPQTHHTHTPHSHTHPSFHLVDLLVVFVWKMSPGIYGSWAWAWLWNLSQIDEERIIHCSSAPKVLPWSTSQSIVGGSHGGRGQHFSHMQPFPPGWCLVVVLEGRFLAGVTCWRSLPHPFQLAYCVVQFLEKDSTLTEPVSALPGPWLVSSRHAFVRLQQRCWRRPISLLAWRLECGRLAAVPWLQWWFCVTSLPPCLTPVASPWNTAPEWLWPPAWAQPTSTFDSMCRDSVTGVAARV